MTYASRYWKAVETTDLVGSKYVLTVTGEVEVRRSNQGPKLGEANPPGISPVILILDLTVENHGDVANEVVEWKDITFTKEVSSRQYGHVTIKGETDEQTVEVEIILS